MIRILKLKDGMKGVKEINLFESHFKHCHTYKCLFTVFTKLSFFTFTLILLFIEQETLMVVAVVMVMVGLQSQRRWVKGNINYYCDTP